MTEKDPGPDQSTTFRLRQSDPGLDIQVERPRDLARDSGQRS